LPPTQDFLTGGLNPGSVSIRDFNSDGILDLAVANFSSDTVSILLNTTATGAGTATFATEVTFPTGIKPESVSIDDFNSDGRPDLAVANFVSNSSGSASILLNTTATGATIPSFAPKQDFVAGAGPYSVSIGDFNRDNLPDLAVANGYSNRCLHPAQQHVPRSRHPHFCHQSRLHHWRSPLLRQRRRLQRRRETRLSNGEPLQRHRLHPAQHHRHRRHHPQFCHPSNLPYWHSPLLPQRRRLQQRPESRLSCGEHRQQHRLHPAQHYPESYCCHRHHR
jgi:hypothetical protein